MNAPLSLDGACRLVDRGVIRASGPDAAAFLQGQLTNDVLRLGPGSARLAGFCSAKGRLQATFLVWREGPEDFLLACPTSLLPQTLKRLSMFVMRAKCTLSDASVAVVLTGAAGATAEAAHAGATAWERREPAPGITTIRLPDAAGVARVLIAAGPSAATGLDAAPALPLEAWHWLDVSSGIVTIEAATVDRFLPQMVNYELVGGVDFQKGCYPGQEVVARSQYRGTTKRRAFLFDSAELPSPGSDVFTTAAAGTDGEPVGTVANAALNPNGGATALVEMRLAHLGEAALHAGSAAGALLVQRALPYGVAVEADAA